MGITYYQVAATVRYESTLKRELASLQQINDNIPSTSSHSATFPQPATTEHDE